MKTWVKLSLGLAATLLLGATGLIFNPEHVVVHVVATNFPGGTIELERSNVKRLPVGNSNTWQIFELHGDSSLVIKCPSISGRQDSAGYFTNGYVTNRARVEIEGCKIKSFKYSY